MKALPLLLGIYIDLLEPCEATLFLMLSTELFLDSFLEYYLYLSSEIGSFFISLL